MQIAIIAFVAFAVAALSGHWLIPALKKLNFGQSILEIGPNWHKNKEGTPAMGGIMFIIGILAASCLAFVFLADFQSVLYVFQNSHVFKQCVVLEYDTHTSFGGGNVGDIHTVF